jgi:hypothetical protein
VEIEMLGLPESRETQHTLSFFVSGTLTLLCEPCHLSVSVLSQHHHHYFTNDKAQDRCTHTQHKATKAKAATSFSLHNQ